MKTAISLNDEIFLEAEQTAHQLGVSRSKLYSMAILEFVQNHGSAATTATLNAVYSTNDSKLDDDIIQANYDLVPQEDW